MGMILPLIPGESPTTVLQACLRAGEPGQAAAPAAILSSTTPVRAPPPALYKNNQRIHSAVLFISNLYACKGAAICYALCRVAAEDEHENGEPIEAKTLPPVAGHPSAPPADPSGECAAAATVTEGMIASESIRDQTYKSETSNDALGEPVLFRLKSGVKIKVRRPVA